MAKIKWESRSLEWIHNVREEWEKEIEAKGMTVGEWIKAKGKIDVESLRKKLGLKDKPETKRVTTKKLCKGK
jgi:hypothetical protein